MIKLQYNPTKRSLLVAGISTASVLAGVIFAHAFFGTKINGLSLGLIAAMLIPIFLRTFFGLKAETKPRRQEI